MGAEFRDLPVEQAIGHDIVPSRIADRMDIAMNQAIADERIVMEPEVRDHLNGILHLYQGQVYRELDTKVRQEITSSHTRSQLAGLANEISGGSPQELTQNVQGQERLIQSTILERFQTIATTTARLLRHIAESEGVMLTRTDGNNGYSLNENNMLRVSAVLLNLTDYVAESDSQVMTTLETILVEENLSQENADFILTLLDSDPNAFQNALSGALDEIESHGDSQRFNQAGLLLASLNIQQKTDLINFGLDSLTQNVPARVNSIMQIALYTGLPIATTESLIDQKIAALSPNDPLAGELMALKEGILAGATNASELYESAVQRMAERNPDVFRITNPLAPSRLVGFAMSYWGAATLFANTILALVQNKPEAVFRNLGTSAVAGTVALMGGKLVSGQNPLSLFDSFASELALDDDNERALEAGNWAQIVNENLLSEVGSDALALWSNDQFIQILNSMGENVPEDQLIRFDTYELVQKLDNAGLGDMYRDVYGDTFLDAPRQEEMKLNLLANAYRELGIRDRSTFMDYAATPYGLTDQDIPTLN